MPAQEEPQKITVYRRYRSAIDASLAKTKLDAHGIPCFLTEEHFSNLYGSNDLLGGGVRLHIFEDDRERVESVLQNEL